MIGFLDTVRDLQEERVCMLNKIASTDDDVKQFLLELDLEKLETKIKGAIEILER